MQADSDVSEVIKNTGLQRTAAEKARIYRKGHNRFRLFHIHDLDLEAIAEDYRTQILHLPPLAKNNVRDDAEDRAEVNSGMAEAMEKANEKFKPAVKEERKRQALEKELTGHSGEEPAPLAGDMESGTSSTGPGPIDEIEEASVDQLRSEGSGAKDDNTGTESEKPVRKAANNRMTHNGTDSDQNGVGIDPQAAKYGRRTGHVRNITSTTNAFVQGIVSDVSGSPKTASDMPSAYSAGYNPISGMGIDAVDFGANMINFVVSGEETEKDWEKRKAGASRVDTLQSGMKTAASLGSSVKDVITIVEKAATIGTGHVASAGAAAPIAGAVTGGLVAANGLIDMGRGGKSWYKTHQTKKKLAELRNKQASAASGNDGNVREADESVHDNEHSVEGASPAPSVSTTPTAAASPAAKPAVAEKGPELKNAALAAGVMNAKTDDLSKMDMIAKQSERAARRRIERGTGAFIAGGIGLSVGIAAATGPLAPATLAAIAVSSGAFAAAKYFWNRYRRKKLIQDVLKEELGIHWNKEDKAVRDMVRKENKDMALRDKEVREIILRAHGAEGTTRGDAYKAVNRHRAHFLMQKLNDPEYGEVALGLITALGVHKRGGAFANGAEELLAEKLSK